MSVVEGAKPAGLVARVTGILLRPKAEWALIATEQASVQGLFIGYAAIIAAIPALARLINGFMPHCFFAVCVTWSPVFVVASAVIYYLLSLAGVFAVGLIIDALAPSFGGEKNQIQAMKAAVYSYTAAWLAGVFILLPFIGILLSLLGLYSLYLLYTGMPPLMKSPQDKSLGYTAVVVLLSLVIFIVAGAIAGGVGAMGMMGAGLAGQNAHLGGTLHFGGGSVDLGKLQDAARQAENAARQAQSGSPDGKVAAIDPEKLKSLLPDNVAGAPRTEISASSAGAAGYGGSNAEATYEQGNTRVTVTVTDLAAAGALAAMAGAINVQSDRQTATGYEKVATINGRLTTERYDNQSRSGEYSIVVANRFNVAATGSGVGIDALKAAVAAVGPDRLEALSHG